MVLIRNPAGIVVGQIDIDSHTDRAFGPAEEQLVRQVAGELSGLWPNLSPPTVTD